MFNVGDMVDVVYTSGMKRHGIALDIISSMMEGNPHEVVMLRRNSNNSFYLKGSSKIWPPWMIVLALSKEPDWEI